MYVRHRHALGEFTPVQEAQILEQLDAIREAQEAEARYRTFAMWIGIGSALFAAARLGLVAIPFIKERRR